MRMKEMLKRCLLALLVLLMVMPTVYYGEMAEQEVRATEGVNKDMLGVKVQAATDTSGIMRFISSVDSLDYKNVGFEVTPEGGAKKTYTATEVFERIQSVEDSVKYQFSPKVVDVESEYFVTAKMYATANTDYTVRAFVTTLDDQVVYGNSRCVSLEDGSSTTTLNMSFEADSATVADNLSVGDSLNVNGTTAEVIGVDGTTVHVRVAVNPTSLSSVTQFDFTLSDGTTAVGSGIYRNLYTTYTGTADRTWFDVYPSTTEEYIIATSADLYGLAAIVNGSNPLNNKTIYVVSDIVVNSGEATLDETDGWKNNDAPYAWTPIGTNAGNKRFNGTFDGQGHIISGLYWKGSTQNTGLFGCTYKSSVLRNFTVTNSYFENSINNAWIGSVCGIVYGEVNTVKSTAIVKHTGSVAGGLFGGVSSVGGATLKNCWFDGTLALGTTGTQSAAVLGKLYVTPGNTVSLEGCMNTGTISGGKQQFGAIVGFVQASGTGSDVNIELKDCLNTESVVCTATGVGTLVADIYSTDTVKVSITDSYTVGDDTTKINGRNRAGASALTQSSTGVIAADTLKGVGAWYNTTLDFGTYYSAISEDVPQLTSFVSETALVTLGGRGTEEEPWTVETAAQLKAMADYAQTTYNFAKKYVKLVNDITVVAGDTADAENWKPIGNSTNAFAGNFNGNGATISGIYYKGDETYIGLFGALAEDAVIENLVLTSSYFEYTGASSVNVNIGSIAGVGSGIIDKVKSEATVVCGAKRSGGFFGGITGNASLSDCWFAGTLSLGSTGIQGGGFSGLTETGSNVSFKHCLNSGTLSGSYTGGALMLGGFVGNVYNSTVTISDSLSVGTITATQTWRGSVIGRLQSAGDLTAVANITSTYFNSEDGCEARFSGVRNNGGTCSVLPTGLTMTQLAGSEATTNASELSFTDLGDGIHWVTDTNYPTLKVLNELSVGSEE